MSGADGRTATTAQDGEREVLGLITEEVAGMAWGGVI
jgi:hypothetical protein